MGEEGGRTGYTNQCHPLLRGGNKTYTHGLSPSQIQSLAAISDTLIPPITNNYNTNTQQQQPTNQAQAHQSFFSTAGSQYCFPDEIAERLVRRGMPEAVFLVGLILKFLSTRLGSLLLCGFVCLDWRWPFIHNFSELSLEDRENVLQKWSRQKRLFP